MILKKQKRNRVNGKNHKERYSQLKFSAKMRADFEIERFGIIYRNIWDIREFDGDKGYRLSFISTDCKYPLNETRIPNH